MQNITNARLNKGLAYTIEERKSLGIHGLYPSVVVDQAAQVNLVLDNIRRLSHDIDKYVFLMHLLDRNERLFYKVLSSHVEEMMPLVYTPTVGEACIKYGFIFTQPKGLFISINDKGHVYDVIKNWPTTGVKVIVVTDGERILGLGDLGAQGMGIPVGKLALYTALVGVDPALSLPITLDVGTNNQSLLDDPNYIGLRQRRTVGEDYDMFIDEFMNAVKLHFGSTCLIQFEDFANHNAFRLLEKYKMKACTYNDDIQGTASVALSGILTATKITEVPLEKNVFLFYGSGEAAIGTANLIVLALIKKGLSEEQARAQIWLVDSKGLIVKNRSTGGINHEKAPYAKEAEHLTDLSAIIDLLKPTALIGAAAQGRVFTPQILEKMASIHNRPIIFALSNPTAKAECTAEEAYKHTKGKAVFASGSPFNKVELDGKTFYPGQGNNCYIFPAFGLAAASCNIKLIHEDFFLVSAESLSNQVTQKEMDEGRVYPHLERIQSVSLKIAIDVAKHADAAGVLELPDKSLSIEETLQKNIYDPSYVETTQSKI